MDYSIVSVISKVKAELGEQIANIPRDAYAVPKSYLPNISNFNPFSTDNPIDALCQNMYEYFTRVGRYENCFKNKTEPELRDEYLAAFTPLRIGQNIAAEAINGNGKTDIRIQNIKGDNLLIAECKWWKGSKEAQKAITQLFGYITPHDEVAALLFFVKNKNPDEIYKKATRSIIDNTQAEGLCKKEGNWRKFIIKHPKDDSKLLDLHLMLFHYPQ